MAKKKSKVTNRRKSIRAKSKRIKAKKSLQNRKNKRRIPKSKW